MGRNNKINILSYWDSQLNYGQILQGVALQYVLKKLGYIPTTIRYNVDYLSLSDRQKLNSIGFKMQKLFTDDTSIANHIKRYFFSRKGISSNRDFVDRGFDDFKERNLFLSNAEYNSYNDFIENYNDVYAYIVGSDQVWNYVALGDRRKIFLLDFVKFPCKKIAYAVSFGRTKFANRKEKKDFASSLKTFDAIGVRESSGIEMCSSIGFNAVRLVPDPTFLLTKEQWLALCQVKKSIKHNLLFVYTLVSNDERIHKYVDYYKSKGYEIVYVSSGAQVDTYENLQASIDEWLYYISAASLVITNSFHGLIFSLNFNTPVLGIARGRNLSAGMNSRMHSILNQLNMINWFTEEYDNAVSDRVLKSNVNWESVNQNIESMRNIGINFLKENLQ